MTDPLHTRAVHRLVGLHLRRLPASVERDDLVQEALIRIWLDGQRHGATQAENVPRLVRWAIIDHLRRVDWLTRAERASARAADAQPVLVALGEAIDEALALAAEDDVQGEAEQRQQLHRLDAALAVLSPAERAAVLAQGGELSGAARAMGVGRAEVDKLRRRGMARLRAAFGIERAKPRRAAPRPTKTRPAKPRREGMHERMARERIERIRREHAAINGSKEAA